MAKKKATTKKAAKKATKSTSDNVVEKAVQKQLKKKGPQSHKELREQLGRTRTDPALGRTLQRLRRQGKLKVVKGWSSGSMPFTNLSTEDRDCLVDFIISLKGS